MSTNFHRKAGKRPTNEKLLKFLECKKALTASKRQNCINKDDTNSCNESECNKSEELFNLDNETSYETSPEIVPRLKQHITHEDRKAFLAALAQKQYNKINRIVWADTTDSVDSDSVQASTSR